MLMKHNVSSETAEIVLLMKWHQGDIVQLFPGHPAIFHPKKLHEPHNFSVLAKKPTLSATESLRRQHHLSPIPINVVCSLVALLALLASILLTVSSLFRFHEIPFCKFECFPCNFSKNHFALKETLFTRVVTLASWPQKTTSRNLDWTLGCVGPRYLGTCYNTQLQYVKESWLKGGKGWVKTGCSIIWKSVLIQKFREWIGERYFFILSWVWNKEKNSESPRGIEPQTFAGISRSTALPLSHRDSTENGVYYEVHMTRGLPTARISKVLNYLQLYYCHHRILFWPFPSRVPFDF